MKRIFFILLTFIAIVAVGFFTARYYAYNAGKRDIQSEETAFAVSSKAIVTEFTSNTTASNKKYLEKPVAISGIITSVNGKEVILDNSVNCSLLTVTDSIKKDQKVTIKGRVVGYDDLLGEVRLDQCNLSI